MSLNTQYATLDANKRITTSIPIPIFLAMFFINNQ